MSESEERDAQREHAELWEKLSEPFPEAEIELLPRYVGPTREVNGKKVPVNDRQHCDECGGFHAFPAIHLHYVGHAGITMRLNSIVGPEGWSLEPLALTPAGTPVFSDGGMWGVLEILGVKKVCFGDAQGKTGPNATKEILGDMLRNGSMRFGLGTYLWSKSEAAKATLLRGIQGENDPPPQEPVSVRLADEAVLAEIRKDRKTLGVDDGTYLRQLASVQGAEILLDTELTAKAAAALLSAYEDKLAATAKEAADKRDSEAVQESGVTEVQF